MIPTITVFANSPDRGRGMARDMPVRWALEEVGQRYAVRPVTFDEMKEPAHRARHPFGQIPCLEEDGLVLFESGAIVLHVADGHAGLLPQDAHGRARAIGWMFSALSSVEPLIVEREMTGFVERDRDWYQDRLPIMEERIHRRLGDLAQRLGDAEWLDGDFSAGDLMMVTVLRRAVGSGLLATHPNLSAYVARGQARPAFQRAFADQLALFRASGQDQAV